MVPRTTRAPVGVGVCICSYTRATVRKRTLHARASERDKMTVQIGLEA